MDGTLLTPAGEVTESFRSVHQELLDRGAHFAVASGRQYPALSSHFPDDLAKTVFIAENGAYVVHDGNELSATPLAADDVVEMVTRLRPLAREHNLGLVWSARNAAYLEDDDEYLLRKVRHSYYETRVIPDLLASPEEALTLAVIALNEDASKVIEAVREIADTYTVVGSSEMWLDITTGGVHKGIGVRALQDQLGLTPSQTMAFGDWLNDMEMLKAVKHSCAMANAHPDILATARHTTGSNSEDGVAKMLQRVVQAIDAQAHLG